MANQGKHKVNPALEWLLGDENPVPTKSRSSHLVNAYIKKNKPAVRKGRPSPSQTVPSKPEVALVREPGVPPRGAAKRSQTAALDHQRKLERLKQLRAPYQYKSR
jgi:hypothetical protein